VQIAGQPGPLLRGCQFPALLVVNNSATLPAAVPVAIQAGVAEAGPATGLAVHFSTALPGGEWLVELRAALPSAAASRAIRRLLGTWPLPRLAPIRAVFPARYSACPAVPSSGC
jgi:hypothetical protein